MQKYRCDVCFQRAGVKSRAKSGRRSDDNGLGPQTPLRWFAVNGLSHCAGKLTRATHTAVHIEYRTHGDTRRTVHVRLVFPIFVDRTMR